MSVKVGDVLGTVAGAIVAEAEAIVTEAGAIAAEFAPASSAEPGLLPNTPLDSLSWSPGSPPPWPNDLERAATINTIITLSVLSQQEINDPDTFRSSGPAVNILRSGGGITKPQTAVESALGINTEFFIDNLEMDSLITATPATGNTNATTINFNVVEPYSMGLFVETMKVAALQAGWKNHIEAPYLLTINFVGWDENNSAETGGSYAKRMIPIKITDIHFDVTTAGSAYNVQAIAWNDVTLADQHQKLPVDIVIKGRDVSEILQSGLESLASVLNTRELVKEDTGQTSKADQYIILFPKNGESPNLDSAAGPAGATISAPTGEQDDSILYKSIKGSQATIENQSAYDALKAGQLGKIEGRTLLGEIIRDWAESPDNINDIGKKKIIEEWIAQGTHPFGKEGLAYDDEKGIYSRNGAELTLSDDLRTFKFKQGTKIQDVIEEVILASTYAKEVDEALKDPAAKTKDGKLKWFKIETNCFTLNDNATLKQIGRYPKVFVFKVVPFEAHTNVFKSPTSSAFGIKNLKRECAKQYQYIYTGKNVDVLDFEIKYNHAYLTPVLADRGQGADRAASEKSAVKPQAGSVATTNTGGGEAPAEGAPPLQEKADILTRLGGTDGETTATSVARSWNETLMRSEVNMVNVDLTIMGDPFYLSDSGLGNYTAQDSSFTGMNQDGHMNFENGEVFVNVLFRTPIDYSTSTGIMMFPSDTKIVNAFSGIYRVNKVTHKIEKNNFTQTLALMRLLGQEDTTPVSLIKEGDKTNSIIGNVAGSVFEVVNITNPPEAVGLLQNFLNGSLENQLQEALESQFRTLLGGLDPLAATRDQLAAALGIDISLVPTDINDLLSGPFVDSFGELPSGADDLLNLGLDLLGEQLPLDPLEQLRGFAEDKINGT